MKIVIKKGFTLAEVLIVLSIIGIIAAMTIPALMSNYNKKIVTTRLKENYSLVSQALMMAQVQNGDPQNWDYIYSTSPDETEIFVKGFVEKYIVPHIKKVGTRKYTTLPEAGYNVYYNSLGNTNTNLSTRSKVYYIVELGNGSTLFFAREASGFVIVYVDINGKQKPNIWGRDAFMMRINTRTGRLEFLTKVTREDNVRGCPYGLVCGALILQDNWEIKDDYPIKL